MKKIESKEEAMLCAEVQSLDSNNKDVPVYIIHCNRTASFYVDTDSLTRIWEQLIGHYVNGEYFPQENDSL